MRPRGAARANAIAIAPPEVSRLRQTALLLAAALVALGLITLQSPAQAQSARPDTFADLVDQVGDAVVNITTTSIVAARQQGPQGIQPMLPPGSPFEDFFNDFMNRNGQGGQAPRRSRALGSGFVISEDGFIVTNNHVIEGADEISVEFRTGEVLQAELIGTDPNTDIALLKVEPESPLTSVSFGDSDALRVGDWVMAMGNPLGQGFSVSVGIISARNRELSGAYGGVIQTDAAINPGNSGGPLLNSMGQLIGVNTAIYSPSGASAGIGFAIPVNTVAEVVPQLISYGRVLRPVLGVELASDNWIRRYNIPGVPIVRLFPGLPADQAGMRGAYRNYRGDIALGDIITHINGERVRNNDEYHTQLERYQAGDTITVTTLLGNEEREYEVILEQSR